MPGQLGQQPLGSGHQRDLLGDPGLEALVEQHGQLGEGDVGAGGLDEEAGAAAHRAADDDVAPGRVEPVAQLGEDVDLGVPPEALGVDQGAVHVEQHRLEG